MPRKQPQNYTSISVSNITKEDLKNLQQSLSERNSVNYSMDDLLNILMDYYIGMVLTNN